MNNTRSNKVVRTLGFGSVALAAMVTAGVLAAPANADANGPWHGNIVKITKVDQETGATLAGAQLTVCSPTGGGDEDFSSAGFASVLADWQATRAGLEELNVAPADYSAAISAFDSAISGLQAQVAVDGDVQPVIEGALTCYAVTTGADGVAFVPVNNEAVDGASSFTLREDVPPTGYDALVGTATANVTVTAGSAEDGAPTESWAVQSDVAALTGEAGTGSALGRWTRTVELTLGNDRTPEPVTPAAAPPVVETPQPGPVTPAAPVAAKPIVNG